MENCMPKVSELREKFPNIDIQVDGGLGLDNISKAAGAGANVIVAGTSIFSSESPSTTIKSLRSAVNERFKN
jgi:ribulose-phosphate 3-epimerase